MKKRLFALLLCVAIIFSLAACGKKSVTDTDVTTTDVTGIGMTNTDVSVDYIDEPIDSVVTSVAQVENSSKSNSESSEQSVASKVSSKVTNDSTFKDNFLQKHQTKDDYSLLSDYHILGTSINFTVGQIGVANDIDKQWPPFTYLIRSRSALASNNIDNEYTEKYDDKYFETKALIVVLSKFYNEKCDYSVTLDSVDSVNIRKGNHLTVYSTHLKTPGKKYDDEYFLLCVEVEKNAVANVTEAGYLSRTYAPTEIIEEGMKPVTPPTIDFDENEIEIVKDRQIVGKPINFTLAANGSGSGGQETEAIIVKNRAELLNAKLRTISNGVTILGVSKSVEYDWESKYTDEFFKTKNVLVFHCHFSYVRSFYPGKIDSITIDNGTLYLNTTREQINGGLCATSTVTMLIDLDKADVENVTEIVFNTRVVKADDYFQ